MSFFSTQRDKEMKSLLSTDEETESQDQSGYIDDYSHLRLSYFQNRNSSLLSDQPNTSFTTSEYTVGSSSSTSRLNPSGFQGSETNLFETFTEEELERQKIREEYISQIPNLPPPTFSVAAAISSITDKMKSDVVLKYHNVIEQGRKPRESKDVTEFNPQRRSTMEPQYFRMPKQT